MAHGEPITKDNAIVITGAAGFIGSCMVGYLNKLGFENLILVDEFERNDKIKNWEHKKFTAKVERDFFFDWLHNEKPEIKFIFQHSTEILLFHFILKENAQNGFVRCLPNTSCIVSWNDSKVLDDRKS